MVVTGDLAEWGMRSEFEQVTEFLAALSEAVEIPRKHVAIVPGNHDVNRKACAAYFAKQESDEREPVAPYWPKWDQFATAFTGFYSGVGGVAFTPDEPWTLFEMPDLAVVVAGLNSTMAESHRETDHYGWAGEEQLRWFADRLNSYRGEGWLRIAAIHHNVIRGAALDEENLRDADDLDRLIGERGLANLLLHGHTHDGRLHRLASGLVALSTGSAAVDAAARPAEMPNQYQLITVRPDGSPVTRASTPSARSGWIGDTRISASRVGLARLPGVPADRRPDDISGGGLTAGRRGHRLPAGRRCAERATLTASAATGGRPVRARHGSSAEDFLDRVAQATRARFPDATLSLRLTTAISGCRNPMPAAAPSNGRSAWLTGR